MPVAKWGLGVFPKCDKNVSEKEKEKKPKPRLLSKWCTADIRYRTKKISINSLKSEEWPDSICPQWNLSSFASSSQRLSLITCWELQPGMPAKWIGVFQKPLIVFKQIIKKRQRSVSALKFKRNHQNAIAGAHLLLACWRPFEDRHDAFGGQSKKRRSVPTTSLCNRIKCHAGAASHWQF